MGGGTDSSVQAGDDGPTLPELLSGQTALTNAQAAAPDLGQAFGANAVQGALDALKPYWPFALLAVVALALLARR